MEKISLFLTILVIGCALLVGYLIFNAQLALMLSYDYIDVGGPSYSFEGFLLMMSCVVICVVLLGFVMLYYDKKEGKKRCM